MEGDGTVVEGSAVEEEETEEKGGRSVGKKERAEEEGKCWEEGR